MCQTERKAWSQTYAWVSVSRKQMSKCDHIQAHTHAHTLYSHAHSCLAISVNLVTRWHIEPNTKHMLKRGVITTAE